MGKLVTNGHWDGLDPSWYSTTASRQYGTGNPDGWICNFDTDFPHAAAIHYDKFKSPLKIAIRRLVERSMVGCVHYFYKDMDYRYSSGGLVFAITHGYHLFRFEEQDDKALFVLSFGEMVSEIEPCHPQHNVAEELLLP